MWSARSQQPHTRTRPGCRIMGKRHAIPNSHYAFPGACDVPSTVWPLAPGHVRFSSGRQGPRLPQGSPQLGTDRQAPHTRSSNRSRCNSGDARPGRLAQPRKTNCRASRAPGKRNPFSEPGPTRRLHPEADVFPMQMSICYGSVDVRSRGGACGHRRAGGQEEQ